MSPRLKQLRQARKKSGKSDVKIKIPFSHIIRLFTVLLLLLVAVGVGVLFAFSRTTWDGKTPFNIVIVPSNIDGTYQKIYFAHIDPSQHNINMVSFPAEHEVKVVGGYGQYPLRSLYPLLTTEKKNQQFMLASYSHGLEKTIDEVWVTNDQQFFGSQLNVSELFRQLVFFKIKSKLTVADRISLYRFLLGLRQDQVTFSAVQTDDEWTKVSAKLQFPAQAADCSVAIINTTDIAGIGSQFGKILEKSGLAVVRVADANGSVDKTTLLTDGGGADKDSLCADLENHILHTLPIEAKQQFDSQAFQKYRGHLVLILGQDMGDVFHQQQKAGK
jgi:hypothetical protein